MGSAHRWEGGLVAASVHEGVISPMFADGMARTVSMQLWSGCLGMARTGIAVSSPPKNGEGGRADDVAQGEKWKFQCLVMKVSVTDGHIRPAEQPCRFPMLS